MALLARLVPDRVVPVAAARDGFLLTPDQGEVFYETAGGDLENWVRLARDAALLQRELVPHRAEILGRRDDPAATRRRPPTTCRRGSSSTPGWAADDPRVLAPEVAARLRAHLPVVRRWAEEVAALGLPLTLNHNDLHENNVFDVDGRLRFFDFGDALVTEPLGDPAHPAEHPRREARRRGGRPTPVAGGRRGAWRSGATWSRCVSCGQRCRPRCHSAGWAGSSRGCGACRPCPTTSWRSGVTWRAPGWARSTPIRPVS